MTEPRKWTIMFTDGSFEFVTALTEDEAREKAIALRKAKQRFQSPSARGT